MPLSPGSSQPPPHKLTNSAGPPTHLKACGLENALGITKLEDVERFAPLVEQMQGLQFVSIKVDPTTRPKVLPTTDGIELKNRFRRAVPNIETSIPWPVL